MCLSQVNQKLRGTSTTILTGYKLFCTTRDLYGTIIPGRYTFRYFAHHNKFRHIPTNKWITAITQNLQSDIGPIYKSGFHIYTEDKYAKDTAFWSAGNYEVVMVRYRGVLARGTELNASVVVAKEMYVPHKKKKRSSYGR